MNTLAIDHDLLQKLTKQAEPFGEHYGPYAGLSWRDLERYNSYEEGGSAFRMEKKDQFLTQLYAGLAVYVRDTHLFLGTQNRPDATLLEEVVREVKEEESVRYPATAFPYAAPEFPYKRELSQFPVQLALHAAEGKPDLLWLDNPSIRHEWTVKAGKRLLLKFGVKLKVVICEKDGPYGQFESGLVGQAALPTTIATQILAAGISAATLWYPLAVYISILLIKTGLKTYCEP